NLFYPLIELLRGECRLMTPRICVAHDLENQKSEPALTKRSCSTKEDHCVFIRHPYCEGCFTISCRRRLESAISRPADFRGRRPNRARSTSRLRKYQFCVIS